MPSAKPCGHFSAKLEVIVARAVEDCPVESAIVEARPNGRQRPPLAESAPHADRCEPVGAAPTTRCTYCGRQRRSRQSAGHIWAGSQPASGVCEMALRLTLIGLRLHPRPPPVAQFPPRIGDVFPTILRLLLER